MEDYAGYFRTMVGHLWSWADRWHRNELAGGNRKRPPVQRPEFASKTVLAPAHADRAREILAALPEERRHDWFRSHRSSQALTQSVFAAVRAFGRTDVLDGIPAECGRPAFCEAPHRASLALEHQLQTLREPEPTSVDVLLEHPSYRVAVECKLMEREFGVCSRPQLKPGNYSYDQQYCDGDYRAQRGRTARCSLTEIGVRYWTYLPKLFEWDPERDLRPCPFAPVYQIARNALAATLSTDGKLDPHSGHVLVVYDVRNPEYAVGGTAQRQYDAAVRASREPGLIRRLSWQCLAAALAKAPELAYLVSGLEGKYGIEPDAAPDA